MGPSSALARELGVKENVFLYGGGGIFFWLRRAVGPPPLLPGRPPNFPRGARGFLFSGGFFVLLGGCFFFFFFEPFLFCLWSWNWFGWLMRCCRFWR